MSSASISANKFMVSSAPLTFVHDPSHHRTSPARKPYPLATAVKLSLHEKASGLPLAAEEKMVISKQFGFVRSPFLAYKNVVTGVKGPCCDERMVVAATESGEVKAARRLRLEQK